MHSHENKEAGFVSGMLERVAQAVSGVVHAGDQAVSRASAHLRDAMVHPLRPFPLAHVAGGTSPMTGGQPLSAQETLMMREQYLPLGIAGLPQATLQNAHRFLTQLPTWLPMPETRRQGQGQVMLEWSGRDACRFSVVIGQDGMMIYSARFGPKGRLDGAEPITDQPSPIVGHLIRQLQVSQ
jgi:hypothetical protein